MDDLLTDVEAQSAHVLAFEVLDGVLCILVIFVLNEGEGALRNN